MMLFSGIFFSLVGLYLDNVIQQTYGTAKKWYFCLKPKFWGLDCRNKRMIDPGNHGITLQADAEDYYMDKRNYQAVGNPELLAQEQEQQILKITGLRKNFGDFKAVNGINLKLYKG